ncbi:MAG: EamA family transporter RarD [Brevundimonas sp.]|nr:EamA family transporter RarD [Brevundimonas sp.]
MAPATGPDQGRAALLSAFSCYVLWGFMPLLFMGQHAVGFDAMEILAHRTIWAAPVAFALVWFARQNAQVVAAFRNPKIISLLAVSTALIGLNWGLYVWATTHHATLEASLGYYINPLLNMIVGLWLFRERIDRWGWVAIGLAFVGVVLQALALGRPPWISLILAVTFASYGVIRKKVAVDAQAGLFIECLLLAPFGIAWLVWLNQTGAAVGFDDPVHVAWALLNGPATVLPLVLFAWSARRLPLSTLGFIQFLAPTIQFGVGVATGESLTALRIASFAFIWGGALVFATAAFFRQRAARQALKASAEPV